jgi:hypothetical protein
MVRSSAGSTAGPARAPQDRPRQQPPRRSPVASKQQSHAHRPCQRWAARWRWRWPTSRPAHWFGTALNPHNGVTHGFNMVGADPALETSTTITADKHDRQYPVALSHSAKPAVSAVRPVAAAARF